MLLGSFVAAFDDQEPESSKDDDDAALRTGSSVPEKYFERRQTSMVSKFGPPPTMESYAQGSLPYRSGPPSNHEATQVENHQPHRDHSQHATDSRRDTREDQRRYTGSSFQTHISHHPSSSRDSSYLP